MSRRIAQYEIMHNGITASALATGIHVTDYRNAVITISTSGGFNGTIKFQGALKIRGDQLNAVDFSDGSRASDGTVNNPWMYVQCIDLEDASAIDGNTGVAYTGTDSIRIVEINTNSFDYFGIHVTAVSAGTVTCVAHFTDNS